MHFFAKAITLYCACNLFFQTANADIIEIHISLPSVETGYSGRLFVAFTQDTDNEPRLTIGDEAAPRKASPFFAVDVANWEVLLLEGHGNLRKLVHANHLLGAEVERLLVVAVHDSD